MPQRIVVKKFGGSMLKTPEDFEKVALHLLKESSYRKQVVILSAPFLKTDLLYDKIARHYQKTSPRLEALLLSTGEQESLATLGLHLEHFNLKIDYLYGRDIPLLTEKNFYEAKVSAVADGVLLEKLSKIDILLIAGFQGLDKDSKQISLLGRGGSDLSAIVLAAVLKAPCYFFKDSGGIGQSLNENYSEHYSTFNPEEVVELSGAGSKVLYEKASVLLANYHIKAFFGSLANPEQTQITPVHTSRIDNIDLCSDFYKITLSQEDSRLIQTINNLFRIENIDNHKEYITIIGQKKKSGDLDTAQHSILECLKVGSYSKISAIRITGCGLLESSAWYLPTVSEFMEHIENIYCTQFKVIITLDDITGKQVFKVFRSLKASLTELIEQ